MFVALDGTSPIALAPPPELFLQLSDPLRLLLFRVLDHADTDWHASLAVAELVDVVGRPQYAVSRALGQLRRAGMVVEARDGRLVYYHIARSEALDAFRKAARVTNRDDARWMITTDRIRWRLEIRSGDRCVVTYRTEREDTMADRTRVLFVCVHNSARSQMAEEYLRRLGGEEFEVESAGLEPGTLNPLVVQALAEDGIDISHKQTRDVFDVYRGGRTFAYVVTVCSREAEEKCPIFPGPAVRLNWPFEDPSQFEGSDEERLAQTRAVRDEIKEKIASFLESYHRRHETNGEVIDV